MDPGKYRNGSLAGCGKSERFRIFLATPSDVPLERKLAGEVVIQVSRERRFRGCMDIETITWDQPGAVVEMAGELTPKEAIALGLPKPEDCDLVVIVLWSRIGSYLPANFKLKENGSAAIFGTEWEYLTALKDYQSNRKPIVWIYRREGAPQFAVNDPELTCKIDQWNKLERFFADFTDPDSSLACTVSHYQTPDDFRRQFEYLLREHLNKLLELLPVTDEPESKSGFIVTQRWIGSPYPGLEGFTPEQELIFFGRGLEIDQLLQLFAKPQVRFVAVVGVSGSGKSSLVKAGLLPRVRTGIIGNAPWCDLIFKPAERGGDPYLALAFALKSGLKDSARTELEIAHELLVDPSLIQKHLTALLRQQDPAAELLLIVDQFEELFSKIVADKGKGFFELLGLIVAHPRVRVIITLRVDFYDRVVEEPILANLLRRDCGTFPLDPPSASAIHQMIIRPAEVAGVEFEDGLAQRLLKDAGDGQDRMALIAFTLHQLYRQEQSLHYLSIDAYEAFGSVKDAVENSAESALQGLTVDSELALPELFAKLVEVDELEIATLCYLRQSLLHGDTKTIAVALTEARLLLSGEEDNQPTLEIIHETVLRGWQKLNDWILKHAESLRIRRDLERNASEWNELGRPGAALCTGMDLQRYQKTAKPLSSTAERYLQKCCRKSSYFSRAKHSLLALPFIFSLFAVIYFANTSQYPATLAAQALFVQLGIWSAPRPVMVTIPAGKFIMGDLSGVGESAERPAHIVRIETAFEIGKYEVTFDEYDLFAAATGRAKPFAQGWGRGDRPVINVSWKDAVAYAQWISDRSGLHYRLPSEAEWEYAARATTTALRYWADTAGEEEDRACTYANVFDRKNEALVKISYPLPWEPFQCDDPFSFTAPVGKFVANDWSLHDMLGNVWEWNQDCYIDGYEGAPRDGSSRERADDSGCSRRVLRGGSWGYDPKDIRSAFRAGNTPDDRGGNIGFRLARTL